MSYMMEYQRWLDTDVLTEDERAELSSIADNRAEIESRFYAPLRFGTAGLRGVMAMGLNRMNVYTVRRVTQAVANIILRSGGANRGVVITHDCRNNGQIFAKETARVLAGNGIKVYLFNGLRPTPELSFTVKTFGCIAGVNITASHNPKEYNGYKLYWEDGAQTGEEISTEVENEMTEIDMFRDIKLCDFDTVEKTGQIEIISTMIDRMFLQAVMKQSIDREVVAKVADTFKLVYTPFHGAGYKHVPEVLRRAGFKHILCVEEQMVIDGNFPTVESPNPEERAGFKMAIDLAKKNAVDLIIGTDPDADRTGIVVRDGGGEYVVLSGNQTGVLLVDYIIAARKRVGTMPENPFAIKTIVTTELARDICEKNGVPMYDTFTGFKFIAERIIEEEQKRNNCIFSYEESFGYLIGNHCRDKDAITASLLIAEMAAYYAAERGITLFERLREIEAEYAAVSEETVNVVMPGIDGIEKMENLMIRIQNGEVSLPSELNVTKVYDYLKGTVTDMYDRQFKKMPLVGSNALGFEFEGGGKLLIRPSGTEPKIKFYILARGKTKEKAREQHSILSGFIESLDR